ncbi:MAG: hypothetical protein HY096_16260 [Nitrospinae bacterium]|nr:hypothetical protein [Nitrospinota bacterium]
MQCQRCKHPRPSRIIIRNFTLKSGHGFADYIFYVVQDVPFIVEQYFSVAAEIEAAVETNLKRDERLWQAILKKAFSGTLNYMSLS